jgi:hypothetical protein
VWGDEEPGEWIILNQKPFWVRHNLWSFLHYARHQQRSRWLWIDALCIDQSNVKERNHQVQQMGAVYSHALKVISWFGPNDNIAKYLLASFPERECDVEALQSLCDHVYWKRAWITQEFLLARRNTLMAGDAELNLSPAFWYALWANDPNVNSALSQQKQHLRKIERMVTAPSGNLLDLLHAYRDKDCTIPRDRLFSLLALCGDATALSVDYETPAPELARNLLKLIGGSICLCGIHALFDALELEFIRPGAGKVKSTTLYAVGTINCFEDSRDRHDCGYISGDYCTNPLHHWRSYHRKRPWLKSTVYIINMGNLCVNYEGIIRIVTYPLIRCFSYQDISVGSVAKKPSWRPISDCKLVMVDMKWECEVRFSVDFFLEMARMSEEVNSHKSCLQLRQPWPKGGGAQLRFSICDS